MSWRLESLAFGENVRRELQSEVIYDTHDSVTYAVFVDPDTNEILLKPADNVEP